MSISAQNKQLTLEELNFGGVNYRKFVPENLWLAWWGDVLMYQDAEESGIMDEQGKRTKLIDIDEVNAAAKPLTNESKAFHSLFNVTFPYPDRKLMLVEGSRYRALYDWGLKSVEWIAKREKPATEDFCAASKATAYIMDDQLYVQDSDGNVKQLTTDGSREIVYGQAVHRNEFNIEKGMFWSNDGQRLAFYRMDQSMVEDYPQVNTFEREATYEPDKYPMAGMTSHKVTVGVYDLQSKKTVYLQAGDPTDRYFTTITWTPDNKQVWMLELNRAQNDMALVRYNAENGERLDTIYRETEEHYVEPQGEIVFLPWDSNRFLLQSERSGYNHLNLFDLKKGKKDEHGMIVPQQITDGDWTVISLVGFNKKKQSAIIVSTECNPLQHNIFAVDLKTRKRTLLDEGQGYHRPTLSSTGTQLFDKYEEPEIPRNITIRPTVPARSTSGNILLESKNPWEGYTIPQYESGSIKADDGETDLYYRMVKPADFDPTKKYPTVIYVYGGPHTRNVEARWHWASRSWETYMANKGYILFILDNRGSSERGTKFGHAHHLQLGQVEMRDQMKGVEYLRTLPYIDMERLGVHGWSYGGFMTISLMTNYPDVFKVGVAGGPVIDWKWYEVMYGERYMSTPELNPEGYEKTSLLNKAANLKGRLQIIIGMNDPTVVPQHALQFINACTEAGTQPDFFAYPGEGHNMMGHKSTHLHERITRYFDDYLK